MKYHVHTAYGDTTVAAEHDDGRYAGSVNISKLQFGDYEQKKINENKPGPFGELFSHGEDEDPNGQMHWTGGAFRVPYDGEEAYSRGILSWAHTEKDARRALPTMLGIAVRETGSLPYADEQLSQYGSHLAKHASKRYGIEGHPNNPNMEQTFVYEDHEMDYLRDEGEERLSDTSHNGRQASDTEVRMAKTLFQRPRRSPKKPSPVQGRLW